jgi:hypothetical protein
MQLLADLVVQALYLAAAVATIGIGALLLRGAVQDALDIESRLPTHPINEDTTHAREANRRSATRELVCFLVIRMVPGMLLVLSGIFLLIWTFWHLPSSTVKP